MVWVQWLFDPKTAAAADAAAAVVAAAATTATNTTTTITTSTTEMGVINPFFGWYKSLNLKAQYLGIEF